MRNRAVSAHFSHRSGQPLSPVARRRLSALAIATILHLATLALLFGGRPRTDRGVGLGAGVIDLSLSGPPREAAPAPARQATTSLEKPAPTPPPPIPESPIKPRSVLQTVSDILNVPLQENSVEPQPLSPPAPPTPLQAIAAASGTPGAPCDIAGAVQEALQADPETHGSVILIPRTERSAANAVLLWNGQWAQPSDLGAAPAFARVRSAIVQLVAAAQPDCRAMVIAGPRFMVVPERDTTMVVVVGNASWRWMDLLVDPPVTAEDGTK